MRYLSIDIETTGLNPKKNQMVEFGAVIEDMTNPEAIGDLPSFRAVIVSPTDEYQISPFVMQMHTALFEAIGSSDKRLLAEHGAYQAEGHTQRHEFWYTYATNLERLFFAWVTKHNVFTAKGKIIPAGKNFFGFDYRFIEPLMQNIKFHHRCLDPVMYYLKATDRKPPDLQLCCERANIEMSNYHTAIGDARMVIELIRCGRPV